MAANESSSRKLEDRKKTLKIMESMPLPAGNSFLVTDRGFWFGYVRDIESRYVGTGVH